MTLLVSTTELSRHLNDPQWHIFDCRFDLMDVGKGERLYRDGHIPGAHFANLDTDLAGEKSGSNGRHPLPSPAAFVGFLARHGVAETAQIVAYDDVGGQFAARLWWLARWVGLKNVVLLDGGIGKWIAEGRALSREVPVPRAVALRVASDPLMVVSAEEVRARLDDRAAMTLIDARAPERFRGEVEPIDKIAGHIPGAVNRFYKENLNPDLTLKSAAELQAAFSALQGSATEVVHQCGSGVTACANIFAMEFAGLPHSKLYAGSWSEWISDPARPTARG